MESKLIRLKEFIDTIYAKHQIKPIQTNTEFNVVFGTSFTDNLFGILQVLSIDSKIANNVAFITLAFAQLFHVFNMSSPNSNLFVNDITKNKFVWIALSIFIILLALAYAIPKCV